MNVAVAVQPAGRNCPIDYLYAPATLNRPAEITAATIYVVGGLYGNLAALDSIERLAAAELEPALIVFNGDFHWFDAEPGWFAEIERRVAQYPSLRGNVETEIARTDDVGAGCGCAYPFEVDNEVVRRSNRILLELRRTAAPMARRRLARLPMHLVAQVGTLRVGIVHGDAASLAGWRFACEALDNPSSRDWFDEVRRTSQIDIFASTHTCLAALRDFGLVGGRLTVINNGAAGMPNFASSTFGVVTRISTRRSPHRVLYGLHRDGVHIDALALHYDQRAFIQRFQTRWTEGSPAYESYFKRITSGPDYPMARAVD